MSKAVLISIRPKWCEKIISGEKTVEVRKTRPRLNLPFKCYIYQTGQGGVIGEFVCDDIFERIVQVGTSCETPKYCLCDWNMDCTPLDRILSDACLTLDELEKYLDGGAGFGWGLGIGLSFFVPDYGKIISEGISKTLHVLLETRFGAEPVPIKRPPQSWCYVEEM